LLILGVDPGSEVTGFGLIECIGEKQILKDYGVIRPDPGSSFSERLKKVYGGVSEKIAVYRPDQIVVEDVFYKRNVKTLLKMGHIRGVVLLAAVNAGVPVYEYSPREVKKAVVGSGSASKEQVQFMVKNILGLKEAPSPNDAADALAVAICHAHRLSS